MINHIVYRDKGEFCYKIETFDKSSSDFSKNISFHNRDDGH